MKVGDHPGVLLLATKRDGAQHTGPAERCILCLRPKVEFVASMGLRRLCPGLPDREIVCANADTPCPMALKAKRWLDALKEATR